MASLETQIKRHEESFEVFPTDYMTIAELRAKVDNDPPLGARLKQLLVLGEPHWVVYWNNKQEVTLWMDDLESFKKAHEKYCRNT